MIYNSTSHESFEEEFIQSEVLSKVCKKCYVLKPLEEYYKAKAGKFGRTSNCKCCVAAKRAIHYTENKEEIAAKKAIYNAKHKEEINAKQAIYNAKHKEEINAKQAIYYAEHAEEILAYQSIHYQEHKEEKAAKQATPEAKTIVNARQKGRRIIDPLYKLRCNISSLIRMAIKNGGYKKNTKTANMLGCTYEEFYVHLESQFQPNMTWQNQGSEWHIDHFFPVSSAANEEHFYKLNNYMNLRPLWAVDNHFKSAKAPYTINESTGEIEVLLECDREYIMNNLERLEIFKKNLLDNS